MSGFRRKKMKGIKEKNYCDKCEKMTWHEYTEGMTKCLECGYERIFGVI